MLESRFPDSLFHVFVSIPALQSSISKRRMIGWWPSIAQWKGQLEFVGGSPGVPVPVLKAANVLFHSLEEALSTIQHVKKHNGKI